MSNQVNSINRKVNNTNKQLLQVLEQHNVTTEYNYQVSKSIKERYAHLRNQMIYVLVDSRNNKSSFNQSIKELLLSTNICRYDLITNKWIISF